MAKLFLILGTFALGLLLVPAWADDHHGGSLEAKQHGYEHGYRDGFEFGLEAKEHGRTLNVRDDINTDRGYHDSFGSKDSYRQGYREGYRSGAEDAYQGSRTRLEQLFRFQDPNFNPDRPGQDTTVWIYRDRNWEVQDVASDVGYRDGINAAMRDFREGKRYKPEDHDAYKDADHGFDSKYGSKDAYRQAYRAAFEQGYRAGFGAPGRG